MPLLRGGRIVVANELADQIRVETVSLKRHGFLQFMKSGSSSKV